VNEIPIYTWFGGTISEGSRVSIYKDGTVEIQQGEASFRASPAAWAEMASREFFIKRPE
jgi:hypothetical protein